MCEMDRVVDVIEKNMPIIKELVSIGRMPLSTLTDYDIYRLYKSIDYERAQMKRYQIVASSFKVSVNTVRRAIVSMEKHT